MATNNGDKTAMNLYNTGYTECIQGCLKFLNNNSVNPNNTTTSMSSSSSSPSSTTTSPAPIDKLARQRLFAQLMRQCQSVNGNHPLLNPQKHNQHQQQQQQQPPQQFLPNRFQTFNTNTLATVPPSTATTIPPQQPQPLNTTPKSAQQHSYESSSTHHSHHPFGLLSVSQASPSNFRRSSVSPISSSSSSSSSCSSKSSFSSGSSSSSSSSSSSCDSSQMMLQSTTTTSSGGGCANDLHDSETNGGMESHILENSTSSSNDDASVWRPW